MGRQRPAFSIRLKTQTLLVLPMFAWSDEIQHKIRNQPKVKRHERWEKIFLVYSHQVFLLFCTMVRMMKSICKSNMRENWRRFWILFHFLLIQLQNIKLFPSSIEEIIDEWLKFLILRWFNSFLVWLQTMTRMLIIRNPSYVQSDMDIERRNKM